MSDGAGLSRPTGLLKSAQKDEPVSRKRKDENPHGGRAQKAKKRGKQKDSEEEKPLNVAWLEKDLRKSYVSQLPSPEKKEPTPKRTEYMAHDPAITDLDKVPKGWTRHDHDIHPDDYKAQTERCLQRLKENIMPIYFKNRLKEIKAKWSDRDERMKAYPGLSWPVVQRLETLVNSLDWLAKEDKKDQHQQVENVKALIKAYKNQTLKWNPGLVTYWSKGVRLCEPRPFDMKEFMHVSIKHEGHTGFWVEGFDYAPQAMRRAHIYVIPPGLAKSHIIDFAIRFPKQGPHHAQKALELDFVDDTGAEIMSLFPGDLTDIRDLHTNSTMAISYPPVIGVLTIEVANGATEHGLGRMIELNMLDPDSGTLLLKKWEPVPCAVRGGTPNTGGERLSGLWMRRKLYTYTAPDNTDRLWIHNERPFIKDMPKATKAQMAAPIPFCKRRIESLDKYPGMDTTYPGGHPASDDDEDDEDDEDDDENDDEDDDDDAP
ncbi:uncharacterized protein N7511_003669 [Penicillium nucicola]|uniref:uncharacterized protein n=1 Tax=Penicillium nucicola TaxID=1850975 RepID=UPI002544F7D0|nr:uncharacterized protein N7511_003669 [Penicillium nucicola]KAJ5766053.1 hypothetical protein N7511_003669 [Penicillium nucicola]